MLVAVGVLVGEEQASWAVKFSTVLEITLYKQNTSVH